jgi:hypothetical protein
LYPVILALSQRYPGLIALFGIAILFNVTAFAPTLFFIAAQKQLTRGWWRRLPAILMISVLGVGMMLNTIRAALLVLKNRQSVFERTPKFGIFKNSRGWMQNRYQLRLPSIVFYELGFACFNIATLLYAINVNNWIIAVYAALFSAGLLFTSLFTIFQTINIYRFRSSSSEIMVAGD